jgi:hypothetical protein
MMTEIEEKYDLNHILIPDISEFMVLVRYSNFLGYLDSTVKENITLPSFEAEWKYEEDATILNKPSSYIVEKEMKRQVSKETQFGAESTVRLK